MAANSEQSDIVGQDVISIAIQHDSLSAWRPRAGAARGTEVDGECFVGVLPQFIPEAFIFGPAL